MAPAWLHGEISKEEAEELLKASGCPDGRFLVRVRAGATDEHVLSVNFRGRPTHHLIAHDPVGGLQINRKSYGHPKPQTLEELVKVLSTPPLPSGWPVLLSESVPASSAAAPTPAPVAAPAPAPTPAPAPAPAPVVVKASSPKPVRREEPVAAPAPTASASASASASPPWMHGEMTKAEAEEVMESNNPTDGKFFLRPRGGGFPDEYVLTVVYKGRATHHLVKLPAPGQPFTINGKATEGKTIVQVVEFLRSPHPFWPVSLKDHVPAPGAASRARTNTTGADDQAARDRARREEEERERRETERRETERRETEDRQRKEREERERREREEREKREREEQEQAERDRKEKEKAAAASASFVYQAPNFFGGSTTQPTSAASSSTSKQQAGGSSGQSSHNNRGNDINNNTIMSVVEDEEDEKARKTRLLREKRWKDGEQLDVTIRRPNPGASFGFGVAGLWRIDGRTKVISWIDSEGPAAGALLVEDEIISINGDAVEDLDLEQVKDMIRSLGNEFKVRILRPATKSTAHHLEQQQQQQLQAAQKTDSKAKLAKKNKRQGTRSTKCSGGVWCPCPDCKRIALQEEKDVLDLSMRVAERTGGKDRLAVVLTRRGADRDDHNSYI